MKVFVSVLLIYIFYSWNCVGQKRTCNLPVELENYRRSDSNLFYLSLFKSSNSKYFKLDGYGFIDSATHVLHIPFNENLFCYINDTFFRLGKGQKNSILKNINDWNKNSKFINSISDQYNVPPEAILFYNDSTKKLFNKYIDFKIQNWESLSLTQSYDMFIDFMNYLDSLPPLTEKRIVCQLALTAKKLSKLNR